MINLITRVSRVLCCVFLGSGIALAFAGPSNAATALTLSLSHATVIEPVAFTEASGMNFGTVMPNGGAGRVALKPDGVIIVQGVLVADRDQVAAASFKLSGSDSQAYTISLPEAVTFGKGADSVKLNTFTHNAGESPVLSLNGYGNFNIGATLLLRKQQTAGLYTGTVNVIISNN